MQGRSLPGTGIEITLLLETQTVHKVAHYSPVPPTAARLCHMPAALHTGVLPCLSYPKRTPPHVLSSSGDQHRVEERKYGGKLALGHCQQLGALNVVTSLFSDLTAQSQQQHEHQHCVERDDDGATEEHREVTAGGGQSITQAGFSQRAQHHTND